MTPRLVPVAASETTLESYTRAELRTSKRLVVQVYHANAAQVFAGIIYRRQTGMTGFAVYDDVTLSGVVSGQSKDIVIDTEGTDEIELRGTLSGAGGNVQTGTTRIPNNL